MNYDHRSSSVDGSEPESGSGQGNRPRPRGPISTTLLAEGGVGAMIWPGFACIAACLMLALVAPRVGRSIQPALATRLLGGVCVAAALSVLWVIGLDAGTSLVQIPVIARFGHWSPHLLRLADPVPQWLAIGCAVMATAGVAAGISTAVRRLRGLIAMRRMIAGAPTAGPLIVIDDPRITAFATPVGGGRVAITTGMLRQLPADERQALLAHEAAHLHHHHYWWVTAADLAASICPPLRATAQMVGQSAERWADECAAEAVGDRKVVARALARAAVSAAPVQPAGGVTAVGGRVVDRVQAMLAPPPARRLVPVWALVVLLGLSTMTAWTVGRGADTMIDNSHHSGQMASGSSQGHP
jgi:Zn-dependent protease with chaperone function